MAARYAESWSATEDDIMRLCAYISNDSDVAAYHGTTVERVAKVRAKIGKRRLKSVPDCTAKSDEVISASNRVTEARAQEGSAQLRERTFMLFRKFAKKQGFSVDDALVVQQFGWSVWHRLRAQA